MLRQVIRERVNREGLKALFFTLLRVLGEERRLYRRIRRARPLVVLNPHQVRPEPNPFWSPLHPRLFEELLRFVSGRFFVTTFANAHQNDTDRPSLILSFDDGYHDYLEHAVPLLEKFGLPSNQNVIGDCVVTGRAPAIVRVCDFLNQAPRSLIDELELPGFGRRLGGEGDRERTVYGLALCAFLKSRPRAEAAPLWEIVEAHMRRLDRFRPSRMMTAGEIRQVVDRHEIGAHSYSHDSMEYETLATFGEDFERCAAVFRDQLSLPLTIYAFPNGSYRPCQVEWLRSRGVEHVLLVGDDYARTGERTYRRFNYYASSTGEARFRALGFPARRSLPA
jgi:peptidoglycan/xylan/chitin deacetylase (PgdA/CDA1 family)